MFIGERAFYGLVGAITAVAFVAFVVWVRRFKGTTRQYAAYGPIMVGLIAIAYLAMSMQTFILYAANGRPLPMPRYPVYTLTYSSAAAIVAILAGANRRMVLFAAANMIIFTWGVVINFLLAPPIESLGKLMVAGGLFAQFYLLFGPLTRMAGDVSEARKLAFGKLRNLVALSLTVYLLIGLTSRQSLGLLGAFTGVYITAYVDMLGHIGFAGILLRSEDALEELAEEFPSPLDYFGGGGTQSPTPEPGKSD